MSIAFYEANAEEFFQRSVNADMHLARTTFAGRLPPGARILDAGCGSGRDALAFHEMGFAVTAIEASPKLAELARVHTGLDVQVMTFDEMVWTDAFDGIWACASLLHVPRAELPAAVARLRDALTPAGVLWMSIKLGTQERETTGRRFTDLDEVGAVDLLARVAGLELVAQELTDDAREDRPGERWISLTCRRIA